MNIGTVRQAMATALAGISNVQINPYALGAPVPPGLQILPPGVDYDQTMHRGLDTWMFIVQGFVPFTADIGSQKQLDTLCTPTGAGSVKAALETDRTLGGAVQDCWVMNQSPGKVVERGDGVPMLLVEWQVQVYGN